MISFSLYNNIISRNLDFDKTIIILVMYLYSNIKYVYETDICLPRKTGFKISHV